MSNRLEPDQARHFVGPDLGPICLQRLSAMIKVAASKERVNTSDMSRFFIICVENIGITIKGILGIVISVSYHSSFN